MRVCPVCESSQSHVVLDLGNHPLADTFLLITRRLEPELSFPLLLVQCENCLHFFSGFPTDPQSRYVANEYSYESANSDVSISHFNEFADSCLREVEQPPESISILDVGSNDGTLLCAFQNRGAVRLIGVDPSPNMATLAAEKDMHTEVCFFSLENVAEIVGANSGSKFDLIVSANVMNHADDPHDFIDAVEAALADDGLYVFEVPNVIDLVEFRAFETVYHEHVHYWSVEALQRVLKDHGFRIVRVDVLDYMCGSLRVFASKVRPENPSVSEMISKDRQAVLQNPAALDDFARDVLMMKFRTLQFLYAEKLTGRRIVGIGAATKGNTLLNYLGLGEDVVEYITDKAAEKIGKIAPGSRISIVSDDMLKGEPPGTLGMILPWNLAALLTEKFATSDIELFCPQITFGNEIGKERPGIYGKA